jgi:P-type E1-E2 ATPase
MRTGEAFEGLRCVTTVVFDKTGTLTEGKPTLHEIEPHSVDRNTLLRVAAAVEAASEHPLAQAIVHAAFEAGLDVPAVEGFEATAGKGVIASLQGKPVMAGNPAFLAEQGVDLAPLAGRVAALEALGRTVIAVAHAGRLLGVLATGDTLRPEAVETVRELHRAGVRVALLTGDNARAAQRIAAQAGIDEVYAGVLPERKAETIRKLQSGARVAMVGDGINDAPALMQADVGIAMSGGTDIAIDSADVILLNSRLTGVLAAYAVSRRGYRKMVQNITLAFLFNGIGVPVAAFGIVHPVWAMIAMAASVTAIFINSLWGQPQLFFGAVEGVGRVPDTGHPAAGEPA